MGRVIHVIHVVTQYRVRTRKTTGIEMTVSFNTHAQSSERTPGSPGSKNTSTESKLSSSTSTLENSDSCMPVLAAKWTKVKKFFSRIFKRKNAVPTMFGEKPKEMRRSESAERELALIMSFIPIPESDYDWSDSDSSDSSDSHIHKPKIRVLGQKVKAFISKMKPQCVEEPATSTSSYFNSESSDSSNGTIKPRFIDTELKYSPPPIPPPPPATELENAVSLSLSRLLFEIFYYSNNDSLDWMCDSYRTFYPLLLSACEDIEVRMDLTYVKNKLHKRIFKDLYKIWESPGFIRFLMVFEGRIITDTIVGLYVKYLSQRGCVKKLFKTLLSYITDKSLKIFKKISPLGFSCSRSIPATTAQSLPTRECVSDLRWLHYKEYKFWKRHTEDSKNRTQCLFNFKKYLNDCLKKCGSD